MQRPDYGIDAPGLVRAFFSIGGIALTLSLGLILGFATHRGWAAVLAVPLMVIAIYTISMGCFMIHYSRVTKLGDREPEGFRTRIISFKARDRSSALSRL